MAAVRDDFSGRKDRKTSKNLRQEYTNLINKDRALIEARRWIEVRLNPGFKLFGFLVNSFLQFWSSFNILFLLQRITFTPFKYSDLRESLFDGVLLCE